MKSVNLAFIGALVIAGTAYGQQPPDVVTSDRYENTAMGTGALANVTSPGLAGNTASGFDALYSNTTGQANTASGDSAY
jgi:hypothetical protein